MSNIYVLRQAKVLFNLIVKASLYYFFVTLNTFLRIEGQEENVLQHKSSA